MAIELAALTWVGMTELFGRKWTSERGAHDEGHVWARALWAAKASRADVERALGELVASGKTWQPSLPEFVALCRPAPEPRENAAAYREYPIPLPHLKSEAEIAHGRAQLAAMRARAASALLIPVGRRARARA